MRCDCNDAKPLPAAPVTSPVGNENCNPFLSTTLYFPVLRVVHEEHQGISDTFRDFYIHRVQKMEKHGNGKWKSSLSTDG